MEENKVLSKDLTRDDLEEFKKHQKNSKKISDLRKEYEDINRSIRPSQLNNIQLDRFVGKGEERRKVLAVKTPVNFQKKIVETSVAFEIGSPPAISAVEPNDLTEEVLRIFKKTRSHQILVDGKKKQKSETEAAILYFFTGKKDNRKLKCRVLDSSGGKMAAYIDSDFDMKYFVWSFEVSEESGTVGHQWVFDDTNFYKFKDQEQFPVVEKHGFDKIPVIYMSQDKEEFYDVKELIDRYEISLSKLSEANDYTGHPMLFINGKIYSMPDKDASGKVIQSDIKIVDGKPVKMGEAKFLSHDGAGESVEFEMKTIKDIIHYTSSTPDLSFESLKGIGEVATLTMQMMFLDPILKAKLNEGENRTIIERMLSVITSGIVTTLNVKLKKYEDESDYKIEFQSILPNSLAELITIMGKGIVSKIISQKTAVETIGITSDNEKEIDDINKSQNLGGE